MALPLTWIEQRLSESGLTIEQLVQSETQKQASGQVSISNSIGSLRFLGAMDWRSFVETMSGVEHALQTDPDGVYGRMDFLTRDQYRHAAEKLAKESHATEIEIAHKAVDLARVAAASLDATQRVPGSERSAHVGYYLVDDGLQQLRQATEPRMTLGRAMRWCCLESTFPVYLSATGLLTILVSAGLLANAQGGGMPLWALALLTMLIFFCSSHLAIALVNRTVTLLVAPSPMPRMDFSKGIPDDLRSLVVVPTMLSSASGIESLAEALEVRFLANRDGNLHFGLLTDFRDAPTETLPDDETLVALAQDLIDALNEKYRDNDNGAASPFFLFHRPRRWNPHDQLWMGHERKRGKLTDLNALLRGRGQDCFARVVGAARLLSSVKYVITLDTDTQLPRDTARQLVGADGTPVESRHLRRDAAAGDQGLRHSAATHGRKPAGRQPLAVCTVVWQRARHRPVHARRVGCVPGFVRGRLVHRQGHLRR